MEDLVDFDADELISLLTEQGELCSRLSALAERQRFAIVNRQPQRLLEVLADRQRHLDRFFELNGRLGSYQRQWREMRPKLPGAKGAEIGRLIQQVSNNLADVLASDRRDVELLSTRSNAVIGTAFKVSKNRRAGMAYAAGSDVIRSRKEWTDE